MTRATSLRQKLVRLGVVPPAVLVVAFVGVLAGVRAVVSADVESHVLDLTHRDLDRAARDLRLVCEVAHGELTRELGTALRVAQDVIARAGGLAEGSDTVSWEAVSQVDRQTTRVVLPKLAAGATWLGQNREVATRTPVVDEVRRLSGAAVTVFQRMNATGDMLRVATTVQTAEGTRAVGTYIPATMPDGTPNPVVATVLGGNAYTGRALVVDAWYLTAYAPVRDAEGEILGMVFVGIRQDGLEALRAAVTESRLGSSGALWVLGAKGTQRGKAVIGGAGKGDGELLLGADGGRERPGARQLLQAGESLAEGALGRARWVEADGRVRLASLSYFEPWDWIVVAEMDETEAVEAARDVDRNLGWAALAMVLLAAALVGATAWLARRAAVRVAGPVEEVARAAEAMALGDLEQQVLHRGDDEVGRLADAFRATLGYVSEAAAAARGLAAGDLEVALRPRSDKDALTTHFQAAQAELRRMRDATAGLAGAAVEGRLGERADAAAFAGAYAEIVRGMNDTLDALTAPLRVAAARFDEIARGEIPPPLRAGWRGDFAAVEASLDRCSDAVRALVADADALAAAAVEGRLSARADASRHGGDFRRIVEGVNRTLDAVLAPLAAAAEHLDRISRGDIPEDVQGDYPGDFSAMRDSLFRAGGAVGTLVADVDALAQAAVAGRLSARADVQNHAGEFRRIVEGVNRTLDAVVAPVDEAAGVLEALAGKDLRARVRGDYQGDHARMKQAVNETAEALGNALGQVARAADHVSSASTQIAASSQSVASGASDQARAAQETIARIEEVGKVSHQTVAGAEKAASLVGGAQATAEQGATAVKEMGEVLGRIRAAAQGTARILRDMSDIAFQTNLLALNAAVEAARAGEAGRGFAVVADEVRSLALRSREAAARTETIIKETLGETEAGAAAGTRVQGRLDAIGAAVAEVTAVVMGIRDAARMQAARVRDVSEAMDAMDRITQANAASAEETSSAVSELGGQAEELAALVSEFRLPGAPSGGERALVAVRGH